MTSSVQCERDEDGRWLAKMPGAIAYGETIEEARAKAEALALQAAEPGEQVVPVRPGDVSHTGPMPVIDRGDAQIVPDFE